MLFLFLIFSFCGLFSDLFSFNGSLNSDNTDYSLTYNGQHVVIKEVDTSNGICSIASPSSPSDIYQRNVPLQHIIHSVSHQDMSNAKVKVVYGRWQQIGQLIGIDDEKAVVQFKSTTEVLEIDKRFIVIYIDPLNIINCLKVLFVQ